MIKIHVALATSKPDRQKMRPAEAVKFLMEAARIGARIVRIDSISGKTIMWTGIRIGDGDAYPEQAVKAMRTRFPRLEQDLRASVEPGKIFEVHEAERGRDWAVSTVIEVI